LLDKKLEMGLEANILSRITNLSRKISFGRGWEWFVLFPPHPRQGKSQIQKNT